MENGGVERLFGVCFWEVVLFLCRCDFGVGCFLIVYFV